MFAGSFALEDAESVAQAGLDELATLVDWSLLKPTGDGRFFMLATIREYAWELLQASGAFDAVAARHLDRFVDLVAEAEPRLTGPDQREWFRLLGLEQENIRAALAFACDAGDGERALALAGNHWRYWYGHATIDEADHWYRRAFAAGGEISELVGARAVFGWAHVPEARGETVRARARFQEAAALFRALGETRWLVLALTHLASAEAALGDPAGGRRLNDEALALAVSSGDRRNAGLVRGNLAAHAFDEATTSGRTSWLRRRSRTVVPPATSRGSPGAWRYWPRSPCAPANGPRRAASRRRRSSSTTLSGRWRESRGRSCLPPPRARRAATVPQRCFSPVRMSCAGRTASSSSQRTGCLFTS